MKGFVLSFSIKSVLRCHWKESYYAGWRHWQRMYAIDVTGREFTPLTLLSLAVLERFLHHAILFTFAMASTKMMTLLTS